MASQPSTQKKLIVVLDSSYSMEQFDTLKLLLGVGKLVNAQENIGDLIIIKYSTKTEVVHREKIEGGTPNLTVEKLDELYKIDGQTAMNDAFLMACDEAEKDKPESLTEGETHSIVIFITDGEENSSKEHRVGVVRERLNVTQRSGVTFLCMGIPLHIAQKYGLPEGQCIEFTHTDRCMENVWKSTTEVCRAFTSGDPEGREYSVEQRENSVERDAPPVYRTASSLLMSVSGDFDERE